MVDVIQYTKSLWKLKILATVQQSLASFLRVLFPDYLPGRFQSCILFTRIPAICFIESFPIRISKGGSNTCFTGAGFVNYFRLFRISLFLKPIPADMLASPKGDLFSPLSQWIMLCSGRRRGSCRFRAVSLQNAPQKSGD